MQWISRFAGLRPLIADLWAKEREQLILWVPVLLIAGAGLYYALLAEPPLWAQAAALTVAFGLCFQARRRLFWLALAVAFTSMAAGFTAAQWRTQEFDAPVLHRVLKFVDIEGTVAEILQSDDGIKLRLEALDIAQLPPERTPAQIRITLKKIPETPLSIGDRVKMTATLHPLPRPVMPGAYDYSRHFFFQGIGALGYTTGQVTVISRAEEGAVSRALAALRHRMSLAMQEAIPGAAGAIAAAVAVGDTAAIPDEEQQQMRDSGLSHILSISGLHMSLAAGIVFFTIRLVLALIPAIVLRYNIKKIAALAALVAAFGYLLLAGSPVPAVRSFIMIAFVFLAVLLDRRGISLYSLAWAAFVIVLIAPESVWNASFQMSFAATLAIVAFYERYGYVLHSSNASWLRKAYLALLGVALTSLAATLSTAVFSIHHFNRFSSFGILANMAVMPLSSFLIMPGVVLTLLLYPLGLAQPGYFLMQWGIEGMLWCAKTVAALPYAVIALMPLTGWGFITAIFGMIWLCLWKTRLRLLGIPLWFIGMSSLAFYKSPDILISDEGKQIAVLLDEHRLAMIRGSARGFAAEAWLRRNGLTEAMTRREAFDENSGFQTPQEDVINYTASQRPRVKFVLSIPALAHACEDAPALLITPFYARKVQCTPQPAIIDRNALEQNGAHAVWFTGNGLRIEDAKRFQGERPWVE